MKKLNTEKLNSTFRCFAISVFIYKLKNPCQIVKANQRKPRNGTGYDFCVCGVFDEEERLSNASDDCGDFDAEFILCTEKYPSV